MDAADQLLAEQRLAAFEQRLHEIEGELAEQAEAIAACGQTDPSAESKLLASHASLRDWFWSLKQEYTALREQYPIRAASGDEF
jgi:hypothetical protein